MLVISHKTGDTTRFTLPDGRQIFITLLEEKDSRGRVRLGINAPKDVRVERQDLWLEVQEEKR